MYYVHIHAIRRCTCRHGGSNARIEVARPTNKPCTLYTPPQHSYFALGAYKGRQLIIVP